MITRKDYFTGPDGEQRDVKYADQLTPNIEENAEVMIERANLILSQYRAATGDDQPRKVNSGWRPPQVNAATAGASRTSRHMTGEAIDLDDDDGTLDAWLMTKEGTSALMNIGLWHEQPRDSIGWAHLQSVSPRSGNRHFYAK